MENYFTKPDGCGFPQSLNDGVEQNAQLWHALPSFVRCGDMVDSYRQGMQAECKAETEPWRWEAFPASRLPAMAVGLPSNRITLEGSPARLSLPPEGVLRETQR